VVYHGFVANGQVVLEGSPALPEGAAVRVELLGDQAVVGRDDATCRIGEPAVPTGIADLAKNVDHAQEYATAQVPAFLDEIYMLSGVGDTDAAGLKIYDVLDRLLIDGLFAVCDSILRRVDVERLDTKLLRSFLAVTIPAKNELPSRADLFRRIEAKMLAFRGEEKTRRILANLA
jgi:hypothetical protein